MRNVIAVMLSTASDDRFAEQKTVAQALFVAIHGIVRMFYERERYAADRRLSGAAVENDLP